MGEPSVGGDEICFERLGERDVPRVVDADAIAEHPHAVYEWNERIRLELRRLEALKGNECSALPQRAAKNEPPKC